MPSDNRVLVVGLRSETMDSVTRRLESDGYIVTGTLDDNVAIDLAASSDFNAIVIDDEIPSSKRGYLMAQVREHRPDIAVVVAEGSNSVVTQIRQAFKERGDGEAQ